MSSNINKANLKGVLNINKPKGITSSDVVSMVRKILNTKAVGHMGTLDPQGEGVIIIGVGKATRLFDFYLKKDKVYEAEFEFGYETDTLDGDGKITGEINIIPTQNEIENVLNEFVGVFDQIPPKYSAKNINGVRAYDLARRGLEVELKSSKIEIYSISLKKSTKFNAYLFEICCSGGTYIRSICRDLAYRLGSLATMISIKRTRAGEFCVEDSVNLDELKLKQNDVLISVEDAIRKMTRYDLDDKYYKDLVNGIKINVDTPSEDFALYCNNEFFGIANNLDGLKVKTYLKD